MNSRLDVFLNGSRNYVQGTQMLSRVGEIVQRKIDVKATLQSASFHQITDRLLGVTIAEMPTKDVGQVAEAIFEDTTGKRWFASYRAYDELAPRRDVPPTCRYERIHSDEDNPLTGKWRLDGIAEMEDVLVAIVQAVKAQHEQLPEDVSHVWFTGMRAATLPLTNPIPGDKCLLEIAHLRTMGQNGQYQSLQQVRLTNSEGANLKAAVSFAFKKAEK